MPGYGLIANAKFYGVNDTGAPLAGGKLYTYEPGTTTAKTTYDGPSGSANANPVVLDSRGEADVWLDGEYKLVLKDSSDSTIWTVDNVHGIGNTYLEPVTDHGTNLASAVTDIGATETTLLIDRTVAVSTNVTVPETLSLWFTRGGSLSIDSGKTVTVNSQVHAGNWVVFDGDGDVSNIGAKNDPVEASWFGTTAARMNKAISAIGATETSLRFDGSFTVDANVAPAVTTTTRYGRKATFTISNGFKFAPAGPIEYQASPFANVIESGLIVRPNSPADMAGDVDAGVAYDSRGYKITVGTSQAVDFSTDRLTASTTPSAGNSRYVTVIARIAKEWRGPVTFDPVTGTNRQPMGGTQFAIEVVSGTEASSSPARYIPEWYEVVLCDVLLTSSATTVTWDMIDDTRAPYQPRHEKVEAVKGVSAAPTTDLEQFKFYALTDYDGGSQTMTYLYDPNDGAYWPVNGILTASTAPLSATANGQPRFDPDTQRLYVRQGGAEKVVRAPLRYEELSTAYAVCSGAINTSYVDVNLAGVIHSDAVMIELLYHTWATGNQAWTYIKTGDTNYDREFQVGGTGISQARLRGTTSLPIGGTGWTISHKVNGANMAHTIRVVGEWRN